MKPIDIHITNPSASQRRAERIALGVPFLQGTLVDMEKLNLRGPDGQPRTLQTRVLNQWPDGSIKWLFCEFLGDVPASEETIFTLTPAEDPIQKSPKIQIVEKEGIWRIDTGGAVFSIDGCKLRPFLSVKPSGEEKVQVQSEVVLFDSTGKKWVPEIDRVTVEHEGSVSVTLLFRGAFRHSRDELIRFEARSLFFADSAKTIFELRLHNPRAARHPGNLWDLGDPSSTLIRECSLNLNLVSEGKPLLRLNSGEGEMDLPEHGARLYQESSGGPQWDSPVHRNREGRVPLRFQGWVLKSGNEELAEGLRAQPRLWWGYESNRGVSATVDHFWERFPKAASLTPSGLTLHLLPEDFPDFHELQGGEQLTETLRFDFAAPIDAPPWGTPALDVRCGPETYRAAKVFQEGLYLPTDSRYSLLLDAALDREKGFKAKREAVDEYGWRNFGELYADHESAFHTGEAPFVSHYNNQYDPLASFYRQYLAGGDDQWGELARNLAAHVADIDINHTDEDREEYCRGLFWHTDHYLDAGLSTHRMASREHLSHKNPAFCGGGPAAEHCYTSGLTLHYLFTGDSRYRVLVRQLAEWVWRSLCGPQTVAAALLRGVKAASRWRKSGSDAPLWPRFPFTRGTGNCLNATLDALELTGERTYLARADVLVSGTVSPADIPQERNLLNAETSWSYTVFLVSLCRYLHTKETWKELDHAWHHGRESLLLYARWMADNEYPYLDRPEILEYPNETWAGQDLRKSTIFLHAAGYVEPEERTCFLKRAKFFLDAGLKYLTECSTYHYTRPLALTLQNGWTATALAQKVTERPKTQIQSAAPSTPRLTLGEVMHRSLGDLFRVVPQTGPSREWKWLKSRLGGG